MATRVSVELLRIGHCRHCGRMVRADGHWHAVEFPALSVLIRHPQRGALLYDTGYAEHFFRATDPLPERLYRWTTPVTLPAQERLQAQLARRDLAPDDIGWCLISHFHADHVGGLRDLPTARFICLHADYAQLRAASRLGGLRRALLPQLLPDDFAQRVQFAEQAPQRALGGAWKGLGVGYDLFTDGSVMAVALPGHVPGQMGLLLRDQHDREVLLCADAVWSSATFASLAWPAWPTRLLMHDWSAFQRTVRVLHGLVQAHPELAILPSHCQPSLDRYQPEWR
ncbi:MBL fold metallo-hydrolase [Xanthomonas campestris pv. campestris]|uniref:MBL fold metallo-hydrolase n=1 Tax=Xanthomonas campestris TaxID=339 RepID=UPI00101AEBE5|nr:MBL fold metallo-hydrolase [Xanthomonas campestris]MCD0252829.1 MBL fold metallo-hydrolase [Xanthomonas campestris pv. campestris]MEB1261802.1 MBL fold metallo-hydrolase [Xanthomonas campestris pv. campestris]MEB1303094.1 MBL fold metallo-hydrolase [Xanthomonas campestris pv. campestris]MEB1311721.1 MBL fold metallo-hydrolase [Xanthomonas campestris pv. campestris]MEB1324106.1 MBL fold metallo-hydrolase [Xanthomonas campestris pv. campestris]